MIISSLILKVFEYWKLMIISIAIGLGLGLYINHIDSGNQNKTLYSKSQSFILTTENELKKIEQTLAANNYYMSNYLIDFSNQNVATINSASYLINSQFFNKNQTLTEIAPVSQESKIVGQTSLLQVILYFTNESMRKEYSDSYIDLLLTNIVNTLTLENPPKILSSSELNPDFNNDEELLAKELEKIAVSEEGSILENIKQVFNSTNIENIDTNKIYPFEFIRIEEPQANNFLITITYDDSALVDTASATFRDSILELYPYEITESSLFKSRIISINEGEITPITISTSVNRTLVNIVLGILLGLIVPILYFAVQIYRSNNLYHPEQVNLLFGKNIDLALPSVSVKEFEFPISIKINSGELAYISELRTFFKMHMSKVKTVNIQSVENSMYTYLISLLLAEFYINTGKSVLLLDQNNSNNNQYLNFINNQDFVDDQLNNLPYKVKKHISKDFFIWNNNFLGNNEDQIVDFNNIDVDQVINISKFYSESHNYFINPDNLQINLFVLDLNTSDTKNLGKITKKFDFSNPYIILNGVQSSDIAHWSVYENKI